MDLSAMKDITVRAGQDIKVAVPIKGHPPPIASWDVNGSDIIKGDRNKIEVIICQNTRMF